MDLLLLLVYIWVIFISLILIISSIIMASLTKKLVKGVPDISYDFFKNLVYSIFTGIIISIAIGLKSTSLPVTNWIFWIISVPLAFVLIVMFVNFGIIYLYFLDLIFGKIPIEFNKNDSRTLKVAKKILNWYKNIKNFFKDCWKRFNCC